MTFYVLANQITTLFISLHLLTTFSFEGEVRSYLFGGNKDDITLELANNNKTLAMKAENFKKDVASFSKLLFLSDFVFAVSSPSLDLNELLLQVSNF
jgi:hypothetical protein